MKRKCERLFSDNQLVLIRDPTDERSPFSSNKRHESSERWKVMRYIGRHYLGLMMEIHTHFAYIADDEQSWDAVESITNGQLHYAEDPWYKEENDAIAPPSSIFSSVWRHWSNLSDRNQAHLTVYEIVPYEQIFDVDEKTDGIFSGPTIYVEYNIPFRRKIFLENLQYNSIRIPADPAYRIKHFPDVFPIPEAESGA
jgi:hypothetical protein